MMFRVRSEVATSVCIELPIAAGQGGKMRHCGIRRSTDRKQIEMLPGNNRECALAWTDCARCHPQRTMSRSWPTSE